jgi:protein O-GlcNAc transferase
MDESIALIQKAIEQNPGYVDARNNLGTSFLQQGKVNEAIAQFQKTLEIKPDNAPARQAMEQLKKRNGN